MRNRRPCPDMRGRLIDVLERVCANSYVTEIGCWEWTAFKNARGYATITFANRPWIATRLIQCALVGEFYPQMDVCHECDNRGCVNPAHLWLGSDSANMQDAVRKGRQYLVARTHCPHGHPFDEANTYRSIDNRGHRHRACSTCGRARQRIKAGWPRDVAMTAPPALPGYDRNGQATALRRNRKTQLHSATSGESQE